MASEISLKPIGIFHSSQQHPYEAGRQPDAHHAEGVIELYPGQNFEQALTGLEGCPRIWVLFIFHHNDHWNPMVLPPRGRSQKIGLFATRSPYRPNPIGMSCVEVLDITQLKIKIAAADLLDGSPILDIKPYIAYADSFPGVGPSWLENVQSYQISIAEKAQKQLLYLGQQGLQQLKPFLHHQLEYEPTNSKKKRVKAQGDQFVLAYRTWRILFTVQGTQVHILDIFSGYSDDDLADSGDPYQDKNLHRKFLAYKASQ